MVSIIICNIYIHSLYYNQTALLFTNQPISVLGAPPTPSDQLFASNRKIAAAESDVMGGLLYAADIDCEGSSSKRPPTYDIVKADEPWSDGEESTDHPITTRNEGRTRQSVATRNEGRRLGSTSTPATTHKLSTLGGEDSDDSDDEDPKFAALRKSMEEHRLASSVGNNERPPSQALSPDAIGQGESDEDELVRLASKFGTILDKYSGSETDTGASIKEAIKTNKNKKHKKSYWNKVCAMEQFEPSLDESIKTIIEMTSNSKEDEAWKNHKIGHYPSEKGRTGVERVSRVRYSNGAKKYNCSGCTDETIISRMERARNVGIP